jgi:hypothetical protein
VETFSLEVEAVFPAPGTGITLEILRNSYCDNPSVSLFDLYEENSVSLFDLYEETTFSY